jgi:EpsI family protein
MQSEESNSQNPPPAPAFRPKWSWIIAFLVICAAVAGFTKITTRPNVIPEAGVSMDLPESVMGMSGEELEISEAELLILPEDTEFAKMNYTDGTGNSISCQIVLSGGDRRSIHRPEACLPGQGWNMLSTQPHEVELSNGRSLTVQKLRLSREVEVAPGHRRTLPMLFLYWYVGSDLTTHDQIQRILRSNIDLLLHNRVHRWAYVIVSAPILQGFIPDGLDEQQTLERLERFIRESVPQFQKSEMPRESVENPGQTIL